ncbi:hypothetical protein VTO73DRAFT_5453 [Trametes versicolor]
MGFTLPPRMNNSAAADNVRSLMARKDAIEAEMEAQLSVLQSNSVTMDTPLVDSEGFPLADVDIWAVRHARVRIIELRNDLKALMDKIMLALQTVYDPSAQSQPAPAAETTTDHASNGSPQPFARVDGVAPDSPAASAGLLREDLVISFGPLTKSSFGTSSLQPLAELVAAQENQEVIIEVLRSDHRVRLTFIPRRGWGGRGLLGCYLVPYAT